MTSLHPYDIQRAQEILQSKSENSLVVYEDDDFLLCDKPFDLQIDGHRPLTLTRLLAQHHPNLERPLKFCHQLDYATSGLLLIAKHRKAAAAAQSLFQNRLAQKSYLALLAGHVAQNQDISAPIAPHPQRSDKMRLAKAGKHALTQLQVLAQGYWEERPMTKVRLRPITGRRHQLRLHCTHIGHPVVGDINYAGDSQPSRMMLHAYQLTLPFTPPFTPLSYHTKDPFTWFSGSI